MSMGFVHESFMKSLCEDVFKKCPIIFDVDHNSIEKFI